MRRDYWLFAIALVSWGALLLLIPRLPAEIPLNWGVAGEVDRYGSSLNLLWLGALAPGTWVLMTVLPGIDPRRRNYPRFAGSYRLIRILIVTLLIALVWLTVTAALSPGFDLVFFLKILLGLLFIGTGTALKSVRDNWFVGIRTPWTLSDPEVWRRTHRLGGNLMAAGGVSFLLSALFLPGTAGFWIPLIVLLGGVLITVVYSAWLWKRGDSDTPPSAESTSPHR